MKASHVTTILLSLTPLATAFPWPKWLPEIDSLVVMRRAASSSSSTTQATQTTTATASSSTTDAADATDLNTAGQTTTSSSSTASGTGTDTSATGTGSSTGTGTGTSSSKDTKTTSSTSVSVSSGAAAGSAVMVSPVTTLTSALYKIGDYVTFSWNYTDLSITPTAVDVIVSASTSSLGASTWTLTSNMTFATDAAYTWDTEQFQSQAQANDRPLVVEMYTLYIYDAESSVTATAGAGSLTANAALTFGLYTGQPYTALASGWVCATCSAALSDNEKRALGFAFTMVGITVATFTWFVTGL